MFFILKNFFEKNYNLQEPRNKVVKFQHCVDCCQQQPCGCGWKLASVLSHTNGHILTGYQRTAQVPANGNN